MKGRGHGGAPAAVVDDVSESIPLKLKLASAAAPSPLNTAAAAA